MARFCDTLAKVTPFATGLYHVNDLPVSDPEYLSGVSRGVRGFMYLF